MTSLQPSIRQAYRGLLREVSRQSKTAKIAQHEVKLRKEQARKTLAERSNSTAESAGSTPAAAIPAVTESDITHKPQSLRHLFDGEIDLKHVNEITAFLKHQRGYKELLDRYSYGPEDTLDRVKATARRVGLDADHLD